MIKKYRKKPVVIEAVQFVGDNTEDVLLFIEEGGFNGLTNKLEIPTLEGTMTADIGDYIIKGIKGEFYPCKPDIFEASYSEVKPPVSGVGACTTEVN